MNEGEQTLDILASDPATARHISYQLAQYFVADNPPESLVTRLSQRYLAAADGDIRAMLETLFHSDEFWDQKYYAGKFKTPYEYVISSMRATGTDPRNIRPLYGIVFQLGMPRHTGLGPSRIDQVLPGRPAPSGSLGRLVG